MTRLAVLAAVLLAGCGPDKAKCAGDPEARKALIDGPVKFDGQSPGMATNDRCFDTWA